jgi:hypothetical protein
MFFMQAPMWKNTERSAKEGLSPAVSSHGHLGKWFEGSTCAELNFVSAKG